jgi:tetratricopeptide (TPR) repeat protein
VHAIPATLLGYAAQEVFCYLERRARSVRVWTAIAAGISGYEEVYVGRGYQRLNDGVVDLAAQDLSTAIDLAPEHGVALALAAIAAVRAGDAALQQRAIKRYRFGSKQHLLDLSKVGKWYARPSSQDRRPASQAEKNRAAFKAFFATLARCLEHTKQRLWLEEGVDGEFINAGYRRLNDGAIDLAAEYLSTAIDLVPEHGVALALAAIAAVRADDRALEQKVMQRYRSASKQHLLLGLSEVGTWYSRSAESSAEEGRHMEENRAAFKAFAGALAQALQADTDRLSWFEEGIRAAFVAAGHRKLNDGAIDLAVEDLSVAIDFLPSDGMALALAAVAAVRAGDAGLQQRVMDRYRLAPKQVLLDLSEVGRWYAGGSNGQAGPQLEENRVAFKDFAGRLAQVLQGDRERLSWLEEGVRAAFVSTGHSRLNDGAIESALECLFTAVDLLPNDGIALTLAAIAAVRAADPALQQQVIKRYRSAPKQLLLDFGGVGRWYAGPSELEGSTSPTAISEIMVETGRGMRVELSAGPSAHDPCDAV